MSCIHYFETTRRTPLRGEPDLIDTDCNCRLKLQDQTAKLEICQAASDAGLGNFFHNFCSFRAAWDSCPKHETRNQ